MGATINANDILHTIANNITGSTLSPGAAANAGASAKGQELNAYSKAYKIISDNVTYINSKSGTNTAAGDLIEEIFFGHQDAAETPYTTGSSGSYGGTSYNVVQGNNYANGFNALFIANAIDQLRQVDVVASDASSTDPSVNASNYRLTQSQGSGAMTLTLLDKNGSTPTATGAVQFEFRVKSGTAAASLKLGQAETGKAVAATTLALTSGATLGMTNNIEATVYIYALNNGGTVELGATNGQRLDESVLHTSTAIDGTADSASTLYSTSARTSVAVRLIGRMRITKNDVTTFDEDPTELSVLGIAGGGTASGELASGEKIYWQDTNQYIQGDTTSITIESDDTLTINSDTLAQINSDTKVELIAPTVNVTASTTANVNSPQVDFTGNVSLTSTTDSHLTIGTTTVTSGYQLDVHDSAPIVRVKSTDTSTSADAKRSRIQVESDDAVTMFQVDVKKEGSADDDKTKVELANRGASSLTAFLTANSTQGVTIGGNMAVTGTLTVSGTTTTVDSTTVNVVDPIMSLGGGSGGTAAESGSSTKDRGLELKYYTGSAKVGFMGWDISANEFIFAKDGTLSSPGEVYTPAATGYANTHIGQQLKIGNGQAEDTMIVFDGNATDIRMGIDDSSDLFEIGTGTAHATTASITINTSQVVNFLQDPTIFHDSNNADASLSIGTSATEALVISVLNGASNKTAESVSFTSKTASGTANHGQMTFSVDEATAQLTINDAGITTTGLTESSARELKTNIIPMSNSLDKIMALQGVNFEWKDRKQGKQIGLIADDVVKVIPEVVQFNDDSPTSLQYSKMVALLIEGMKEQQNEINELKKLVSKSK